MSKGNGNKGNANEKPVSFANDIYPQMRNIAI